MVKIAVLSRFREERQRHAAAARVIADWLKTAELEVKISPPFIFNDAPRDFPHVPAHEVPLVPGSTDMPDMAEAMETLRSCLTRGHDQFFFRKDFPQPRF